MVIQLIPGKLETSCASMHKTTWETKEQPLWWPYILQQASVDFTLPIAELLSNTGGKSCGKRFSEMLNIGWESADAF
jgi:hypothetical protein